MTDWVMNDDNNHVKIWNFTLNSVYSHVSVQSKATFTVKKYSQMHKKLKFHWKNWILFNIAFIRTLFLCDDVKCTTHFMYLIRQHVELQCPRKKKIASSCCPLVFVNLLCSNVFLFFFFAISVEMVVALLMQWVNPFFVHFYVKTAKFWQQQQQKKIEKMSVFFFWCQTIYAFNGAINRFGNFIFCKVICLLFSVCITKAIYEIV